MGELSGLSHVNICDQASKVFAWARSDGVGEVTALGQYGELRDKYLVSNVQTPQILFTPGAKIKITSAVLLVMLLV